jgi:hypothetical protein
MGAYGKQKVESGLHWVMLVTTSKCPTDRRALIAYMNEASLGPVCASGDVCLIVRIGKAGEMLAYPTVVQLKEEWRKKVGGK